MRRWQVWAATATAAAVALAGTTAVLVRRGGNHPRGPDAVAGIEQVAAAPNVQSWAPAPVERTGLRTLAESGPDGFALHTAHGPVTFLAGVNLGATTPGHQPDELAISAGQYHEWFSAMGHLGVRVIRIHTIHPPAFYFELRRYNEGHRDAPLYLMQGVHLPDESYLRTGDLHAPGPTQAFTSELRDAVGAVHGNLDRPARERDPARSWRSDVSAWLAGWIVGVEWDPAALARSDARNRGRPPATGRYFATATGASPTERWLAARMEELAAAQAQRGRSAPVAFVNRPTTDPLRHRDEPLPHEDLIGLDANHIIASPRWPGGHFASYHAYPYYPDFQRYEAELAAHEYNGRSDPYAGYLTALAEHHSAAGLPVLVTEFGVPSALGSAHDGPLGRDQGDHSEQEAMQIDADLLHLIKDSGLSGGLIHSWADEWFRPAWNTVTHQVPGERRQLWHDPLTNEQWFGLVAMDPAGHANPDPLRIAGGGRVRSVTARVDESYLHLDVTLTEPVERPLAITLDPVKELRGEPPPGSTDEDADVALQLDPLTRTGSLRIRRELDTAQLDGATEAPALSAASVEGWVTPRLLLNRAHRLPSTGVTMPEEYLDIGDLRWGTWDPADRAYDSRATWRAEGARIHVRLPWAMAGLADPSSHQVLVPGWSETTMTIDGIGLSVSVAGPSVRLGQVTWSGWDRVGYRARLKAGAGAVRDAFANLVP